MFKSIALVSLLAIGVAATIGRDQAVGAKGRLTCGKEAASGVLVKLWDNDSLDPDDLLATTYTDENGEYSLQGWTDEITTIEPKLNYYHDCNDGIKPCQRKFTIRIPDKYIASGRVPTELFDAGVLELEGEYPGEERDCIH